MKREEDKLPEDQLEVPKEHWTDAVWDRFEIEKVW